MSQQAESEDFEPPDKAVVRPGAGQAPGREFLGRYLTDPELTAATRRGRRRSQPRQVRELADLHAQRHEYHQMKRTEIRPSLHPVASRSPWYGGQHGEVEGGLMSYVVALAAAIAFNAVDRIVTRRALRDHDLADEFLLVYQLTCTVLVAPFAIAALVRPDTRWTRGLPLEALGLILATVCLWALYSVFAFRSARLLELSVGSTIGRLRIVITAFLGVLVFGESLSGIAVFGVVLLLLAFIPISKLPSHQLNPRGVGYAVLSTLAISFALIVDKALTGWFSPEVVIFIGFAGTTVVAFFLNRKTSISQARPIARSAIITGTAGAAGYFMLVVALAAGPASVILPVYQASAILYVLAGIVLLQETGGWKRKLLAGVITTAGTALVIGS